METFRGIYVNCLNRLTFLTEVNTKLQIMHLFGKLKDHNLGGIMKARQMSSFFLFTFSALTVTIIFVFENSQNSVFMWSPLSSI